MKEAVVEDADGQGAHHVAKHGAHACRIDDVTGKRTDLLGRALQLGGDAGGRWAGQDLAGVLVCLLRLTDRAFGLLPCLELGGQRSARAGGHGRRAMQGCRRRRHGTVL
jgi:hypothetical protein